MPGRARSPGCASRTPTTPTTTRSRGRRGTSRPRCSTSSPAASAAMPPPQLAERIPELKARARFRYSGEGYVYLQRCIEHVTGQPLDALVRAAVFEPLSLASSSYAWAAPRDAAVAAGHDRDGAPSARYVGEHPNAASSLHTTPRDFARFLAALLTVGNEPWRLGQASVSEMLRPQARIDERIAWGLGWGLAATAAGQSFWHWGDNPGYKCFAVALPATRTGVVVMTNGDGGLEVCAAIVRRMLAGDHPAFAWLSRRGWYQPSASPQGSRRQ